MAETAPDPALLAKARRFLWQCSCGAKNQKIRLDKRGRPFAHCAACGRIIFWLDPEKFLTAEPFCRHGPPVKPTKAKGIQTSWCGLCQIRVFEPIP